MSRHAAMIFAAGLGSRMGSLTQEVPKPLLRVGGTSLLEHALSYVPPTVERVVVNVHHHAEQIIALSEHHGFTISDERTQLLETGGGLKHALPLLGDAPVFTLNSDAVFYGPSPGETLSDAWNPDVMDGLLLLIPKIAAFEHTGPGDFILGPNGRIRFGPGAIYTGIQIIKTDKMRQIEETKFTMHALWEMIEQSGRLYGCLYPGSWIDVGTPAGLRRANKMAMGAHV